MRSAVRWAALKGVLLVGSRDASTAECSAHRSAVSWAARSDGLSVASMAATKAVTMDACWAGLKAALTAMTMAVGMVFVKVAQTDALMADCSAAR